MTGSFFEDNDDEVLAAINMIPLIDIMLVLLVIFIITAPLLTHAVKINLPKAANVPNLVQPESVQIGIDSAGQVYWNGKMVDKEAFETELRTTAARSPQPELQLRAERTTPYEKVAQVMSAATHEGLTRIAFVTDPAINP